MTDQPHEDLEPDVGTAIVTAQPIEMMSPQQIEAMGKRIEALGKAKQQLVKYVLRGWLLPRDFTDFGGVPYLQGVGAQRLLAVGLKVSKPRFEVTLIGDDVLAEAHITVTWARFGIEISEVGTCSTRDKLWDNDKDNCTLAQLMETCSGNEKLARAILAQNVRKKAYMNALSRGVGAALGIRGMTWEQLADAGFKADRTTRVAFAAGETSAAKKARKAAPNRVTITELKNMGLGSVVSTSGEVLAIKEWPKSKVWDVTDGTTVLKIMIWTTDPVPAFSAVGKTVFFPVVKLKDYKGDRQYVTEDIEPFGGTDDGPEHTTNGSTGTPDGTPGGTRPAGTSGSAVPGPVEQR